ncbi:MAG: oligopeptide/dipeptide ABC transporter ATP-binding protein [Pseudomonadota bacterium]
MTPLIALDGISKRFSKKIDVVARLANVAGARYRTKTVHAVDGIDLEINEGEVVGLVGESGCGKSTLGRVVAGLYEPSDGKVRFRGKETAIQTPAERRAQTIAVQMVFQDPMSSLNPRKRIIDTIGEAPVVHGLVPAAEKSDYVDDLLGRVGLEPDYRRRLPHQFSGGQRQRIGIARALAVKPEFLVCDEAVAALDVSIQAQILNLFMDLKDELGLTSLFISHDLGVVHHIADRVVIMYLGRVVESAPKRELFAAPNHPYTTALLADVPRLNRRRESYQPIKGELPSPIDPPSGCHFHPRCPHAFDRCRTERPLLKTIAPGRQSACHLNDG